MLVCFIFFYEIVLWIFSESFDRYTCQYLHKKFLEVECSLSNFVELWTWLTIEQIDTVNFWWSVSNSSSEIGSPTTVRPIHCYDHELINNRIVAKLFPKAVWSLLCACSIVQVTLPSQLAGKRISCNQRYQAILILMLSSLNEVKERNFLIKILVPTMLAGMIKDTVDQERWEPQ